ncbi:MAG: substrate-binding domain-containing protein [Actinomycetota bacterium]
MRFGKAGWLYLIVALSLIAAACGGSDNGDSGGGDSGGGEGSGTGEHSEFFDQAQFEEQLAQREITPEGPEGEPWLQAIEPEMVDTSEFRAEPPWNVCFSNAAVDNPWRVVGFETMNAEVDAQSDIGEFNVVDAEANDEKQISDIQDLARGNCDALIVSPNTTEALTPAVEQACENVPVIVFDRGVNTDCPTTFIHPIGGYAFGADAAEFLVDNIDSGGNILALRILPGVDVLETRWSAAKEIFDDSELNVVGVEFTEGDAARVKSIVGDFIQRFGTIDGVWMDAGATSVAAAEAFEDNGMGVPPITGEDQNDFLIKWQEDGLTAVAPTYPTYQWRTAVLAATQILSGEEVPKEWVLPQPRIDESSLGDYVAPDMPPLFYALCGCQEMDGFPERWSE